MKLYEIPEAYRAALNQIHLDEETGEVTGLEAFEQFNEEKDEKIKNSAFYILELKNDQQAIKDEIARLKARLDSTKRREEFMKKLVRDALLATDTKKVKTPLITVSLRKSIETVIDDEAEIPKEFMKEVVTVKPDVTNIKKQLIEGVVIPGAHLLENQNVQIK